MRRAWGLAALLLAETARAACGDAERKTDLYQAVEACQLSRAAQDPTAAQAALDQLGTAPYCLTAAGASSPEALRRLCANPVEEVCRKRGAKLLNSRCELTLNESKQAARDPAYVQVKCAAEAQRRKFLDGRRRECGAALSPDDCETTLKAKYAKELAQIERKLAYTPERVGRITRLFDEIHGKYFQMIQSSAVIPASQKSRLLEKIRLTRLNLATGTEAPACANSAPDGPATGIENIPLDRARGFRIQFCIGAVATLDRFSDVELMHTLAHEISHSIDPCVLDVHLIGQSKTLPAASELSAATTYPALLPCLRGGTGCADGVLRCNTDAGIRAHCDEEVRPGLAAALGKTDDRARRVEACVAQRKLLSACPWAPHDLSAHSLDASSLRATGEPVEQVEEAFADFMGAEVTGAVLQARAAAGGRTDAQRYDDLVSIATDNAHLHGDCLRENSLDSHPAGYLRVGRIMLGSKGFREQMCGAGAPAPTFKGAGATCQGL